MSVGSMVDAVALTAEQVPADSLVPYPGNPRRGDVNVIRESLRTLGQYKPLVVQRSTRHVLAGNHTLQALIAEGRSSVSVVFVDADDESAARIVAVDNRSSDAATFDNAELVALLQSLPDLTATGYASADLDALLASLVPPEKFPVVSDPDEAPPLPVEPVSKVGDVWLLGPHRLLVGDCTDVAAVEAMFDGRVADCMWTDPPYGVEYGANMTPEQARKARKRTDGLTIQNDGEVNLPDLLAGAFATATVVLKPGAPFYIAHPPGPISLLFGQAVLDAGWRFAQGLVWAKDSMVLGRSDYHYKHEPILYGFTAGGDGRRGRGGEHWFGDNSQVSVFEVDRPKRNKDHPTMKPTKLVADQVSNSCPPGGLVFEPFGGSGSTMLGAHLVERVCFAVELDPRYADVICRRYQQVTGGAPVLQSADEPRSFLDRA
jgi:DNA modification methylase